MRILSKRNSSQTGWVLLEVMISTLIIMLLLTFMVPILHQAKQHNEIVQQRFQAQSWIEGFKDNLKAQWEKLAWFGCNSLSDITIEIGHSDAANLPSRVRNKAIQGKSDWMKASLLGECLDFHTIDKNTFTFSSDCKWKAKQEIVFSHCLAPRTGWVDSVSGAMVSIQLNETVDAAQTSMSSSGLLLSKQEFVWYLAQGKGEHMSFWRAPLASGNALELWSGIKQIAIYPLLDLDFDGRLDELSTEYGKYTASSLKAIWVESLVVYENCKTKTNDPLIKYKNFRGDTWIYNGRCEFVADFIVPLSVF